MQLTGWPLHQIFRTKYEGILTFSRGSSWPRIEPTFLVSPALAGRFFTSATWEAPTRMVRGLNHNIKHTEITDTATRHSVRCFRHGISVNIYTNNRKKCLHLHCTDEEVGIQREKVFITTRLVCGDSWIWADVHVTSKPVLQGPGHQRNQVRTGGGRVGRWEKRTPGNRTTETGLNYCCKEKNWE